MKCTEIVAQNEKKREEDNAGVNVQLEPYYMLTPQGVVPVSRGPRIRLSPQASLADWQPWQQALFTAYCYSVQKVSSGFTAMFNSAAFENATSMNQIQERQEQENLAILPSESPPPADDSYDYPPDETKDYTKLSAMYEEPIFLVRPTPSEQADEVAGKRIVMDKFLRTQGINDGWAISENEVENSSSRTYVMPSPSVQLQLGQNGYIPLQPKSKGKRRARQPRLVEPEHVKAEVTVTHHCCTLL